MPDREPWSPHKPLTNGTERRYWKVMFFSWKMCGISTPNLAIILDRREIVVRCRHAIKARRSALWSHVNQNGIFTAPTGVASHCWQNRKACCGGLVGIGRYILVCNLGALTMYPVDKEDLNTGNGIVLEGAMECTSLGSLLRPLFYFLCSILLIHSVADFKMQTVFTIRISPNSHIKYIIYYT